MAEHQSEISMDLNRSMKSTIKWLVGGNVIAFSVNHPLGDAEFGIERRLELWRHDEDAKDPMQVAIASTMKSSRRAWRPGTESRARKNRRQRSQPRRNAITISHSIGRPNSIDSVAVAVGAVEVTGSSTSR